ncbi:MAG: hypothetical protein HYW33_01360 [Candidatus Blackburnbacteria bacterium]|nr:hypothetical protein [Candidatus Blackburnbacteria bacterium]
MVFSKREAKQFVSISAHSIFMSSQHKEAEMKRYRGVLTPISYGLMAWLLFAVTSFLLQFDWHNQGMGIPSEAPMFWGAAFPICVFMWGMMEHRSPDEMKSAVVGLFLMTFLYVFAFTTWLSGGPHIFAGLLLGILAVVALTGLRRVFLAICGDPIRGWLSIHQDWRRLQREDKVS